MGEGQSLGFPQFVLMLHMLRSQNTGDALTLSITMFSINGPLRQRIMIASISAEQKKDWGSVAVLELQLSMRAVKKKVGTH